MDFVNEINRDQLIVMVYNLRRLMSIFSINELKAKLESLVLIIIAIYSFILVVLRNNKLEITNYALKYLVH